MYELAPNTTLQNGKYRIIKAIGQGTFGITYLAAMQESGDGCDLEVEVAVKEFFMKEANTRNAQDESSVTGSQSELFIKYRDKFKTEAKNLEKMSRYGDIVKIYDVFDENNTAYFSMEYIDGVNLDDYIKQCGHIAENEAVEYIKKIATALKHLHDSRMLHLDLKPKNVMRSNDGRLYLIDFGLSKQYLDNGEAESSSTIGLGTAGYAPIEQANFKGGFAPTLDIYALGATFYKMLTGITAPESSDIYNNGFAPLTQQMQSCSISTKTISVVEKAMQLRKADRFQSVDEFLNAFDGTIIEPPPPEPKPLSLGDEDVLEKLLNDLVANQEYKRAYNLCLDYIDSGKCKDYALKRSSEITFLLKKQNNRKTTLQVILMIIITIVATIIAVAIQL